MLSGEMKLEDSTTKKAGQGRERGDKLNTLNNVDI